MDKSVQVLHDEAEALRRKSEQLVAEARSLIEESLKLREAINGLKKKASKGKE